MRRFLVRSNGPESFVHTRYSADFTIITSGFEFSAHTGLDLHRTDLVVLSACETGLGEIHSGEGLFGFRRAFGLAGARMLVVSLWKVADAETQELMHIFYEHLLRGKPVQLALHCAKLEVRKRHRDPFYWAAFICIGRDPVRGKDA